MPDLDEIRESFEFFDGDGDGRIDRIEFKRLLEVMGGEATDEEVNGAFDALDADKDGAIDFHGFSRW